MMNSVEDDERVSFVAFPFVLRTQSGLPSYSLLNSTVRVHSSRFLFLTPCHVPVRTCRFCQHQLLLRAPPLGHLASLARFAAFS